MVLQRLRRGREAVTGEIVRGGDGHHTHVRPDAHRDHVLRHLFSQPDAGVETPGDDVGQAVVDGDFHVDIRVIDEKSAQHRPQHRIYRVFAGGDADVAGGPIAHFTQRVQLAFNLRQARADAVEQPLTGLGGGRRCGWCA